MCTDPQMKPHSALEVKLYSNTFCTKGHTKLREDLSFDA